MSHSQGDAKAKFFSVVSNTAKEVHPIAKHSCNNHMLTKRQVNKLNGLFRLVRLEECNTSNLPNTLSNEHLQGMQAVLACLVKWQPQVQRRYRLLGNNPNTKEKTAFDFLETIIRVLKKDIENVKKQAINTPPPRPPPLSPPPLPVPVPSRATTTRQIAPAPAPTAPVVVVPLRARAHLNSTSTQTSSQDDMMDYSLTGDTMDWSRTSNNTTGNRTLGNPARLGTNRLPRLGATQPPSLGTNPFANGPYTNGPIPCTNGSIPYANANPYVNVRPQANLGSRPMSSPSSSNKRQRRRR